MNRFREALKIIPLGAWAVVAAVWLAMLAVVSMWVMPSHKVAENDVWFEMITAFPIVPLIVSAYILLVGYIYADSRRRGMRHVVWTLLAIFIPSALGILLYFLLRDGLMRSCPKCGSMASGKFAFCASCGNPLAVTCQGCNHAVESAWSHCPHCGRGLRAA